MAIRSLTNWLMSFQDFFPPRFYPLKNVHLLFEKSFPVTRGHYWTENAALERSDDRLPVPKCQELREKFSFQQLILTQLLRVFWFFFLSIWTVTLLSLLFSAGKTHWNHVSQVSDLFHCFPHCFMHLNCGMSACNNSSCAKRRGVNRTLAKGISSMNMRMALSFYLWMLLISFFNPISYPPFQDPEEINKRLSKFHLENIFPMEKNPNI